MLPSILWLVYAVPAYILWTLVFPIRYGFWPVKERFPPRNLYGWVDLALGITLIVYSAWLVLAPAPDPLRVISVPVGVVWWAAGFMLRWWAVFTLGPHWRIGQDASDDKAEFVATGPYRIMHHPINAALILVAIGQAFLTGIDARALTLLAVALLYFLIQGRAEERRWRSSPNRAVPSESNNTPKDPHSTL